MRQQDWTEKLRDRLADYESPVADDLWAAIEQSLPQQRATALPLWRRWAAAAAVAAVVVGGGWWLWTGDEVPTTPQQVAMTTVTNQHVANQHVANQHVANQHMATDTPRTPSQQQLTPTQQPQPTPIQTQPKQAPQPQQQRPADNATRTVDNATKTVDKTMRTVNHATRTVDHTTASAPTKARSRRTVSFGLHANGGLLAYNQSSGVRMSPQMASYYDNSAYMPTRQPSAGDVIWLTGYEERQHHDHPIAVGLTVALQLSPRWSVETGVVYTRLHADFVNIMHQVAINKEQTLHYVGVPLSLRYHLLNSRRWTLYASAVAQADWNVAARQQTEGVSQTIGKDRLQWSAGGAVGAEFRPVPLLGLYAEPGLRYYFDNGSHLQNYYKEHPFNWSLQVGLRLNLGRKK